MKDNGNMSIKELIRKATTEALLELGVTEATFAVEWPADMAHGDYAVNAALANAAAAKELGKNPRELASELTPLIATKLGELASSVEVAGPGFINITLSPSAVAEQISLATALHKASNEDSTKTLHKNSNEKWGMNTSQEGKRVMVEYGNPNPFKEMHIGHMTGAIIGESISRILASSGATVLRDTFGGDVGPHVAKALWYLRKNNVTDIASPKEIGSAYIQGSNAYEEDPTSKSEIDELNTQIYRIVEAKDETTLSADDRILLELWRKGREISMEEFGRLFALLGTKFDYTFFDSETTELGIDQVKRGIETGIFEESDGAIVYRGEKVGLFTLVFITSRGTPTYETKDIGLAFLKEMQVPTDEVIIITAVEQIGHFKVVLAALREVAPALAEKTKHVPHGLLQLTTGKMSSRKGNIITAAELIKEIIEDVQVRNEDPLIAEQVAIGAIKYMILRSAPGSNIIFDPEKSLSLEGDSGPYLQYALVRAKSVIANAKKEHEANDETREKEKNENESSKNGPANDPYPIQKIERLIIRFPEVVAEAQRFLAPHTITQYLTQLAGEWNSFYAQERIIGGAHEAHKLKIAAAFVTTMQNGLTLLGIPVPEKM